MLVGCWEDGAAQVSLVIDFAVRAAAVADSTSPRNVGSDVPGVTLRFTEDGKSALVGSRPGMADAAGCALLQACR